MLGYYVSENAVAAILKGNITNPGSLLYNFFSQKPQIQEAY